MSKKLKNVTGSEKKEVDLGGRPPVVFTEEQIEKLRELAPYLNYQQIADYFETRLNRDNRRPANIAFSVPPSQ